MENLKIGQFIRDRRIELGMTQQQLADKLDITDKAVSKWERSVSYPDITILRELSAALAVSVNELLAGERDPSPAVPLEVQEAVVDTVAYAETARKRNSGWRFWTFVALTIGCLIAALVMFILYLTLGGSPESRRVFVRVIQIIAISWAICYPLLRTDNHPVRNAMVIASVAVYPLVLTCIHPYWYAWHFGVITISVAYAWAVYVIWSQRMDWLKTVVLIGILGVVLHWGIVVLIRERDGIPVALIVCAVLAVDVLCLWGSRLVERVMARRMV